MAAKRLPPYPRKVLAEEFTPDEILLIEAGWPKHGPTGGFGSMSAKNVLRHGRRILQAMQPQKPKGSR